MGLFVYFSTLDRSGLSRILWLFLVDEPEGLGEVHMSCVSVREQVTVFES